MTNASTSNPWWRAYVAIMNRPFLLFHAPMVAVLTMLATPIVSLAGNMIRAESGIEPGAAGIVVFVICLIAGGAIVAANYIAFNIAARWLLLRAVDREGVALDSLSTEKSQWPEFRSEMKRIAHVERIRAATDRLEYNLARHESRSLADRGRKT